MTEVKQFAIFLFPPFPSSQDLVKMDQGGFERRQTYINLTNK